MDENSIDIQLDKEELEELLRDLPNIVKELEGFAKSA